MFVVLLLIQIFSFQFLVASWTLISPSSVSRHNLIPLHAAKNDDPQWPRYLRWYQASPSSPMELQTRVLTFQKPSEGSVQSTIYLHAQFHFADRPDYYTLSSPVDAVFYELLLDESLLIENGRRRQIQNHAPLQASVADQQVARQYGWICQVDATNYRQSNWYHADWTRQELLSHLPPPSSSFIPEEHTSPLWQQARRDRWPAAAYEATTALWTGPPIVLPPPSTSSIRRRIFTHLFLPGDSIALGLRTLLWITVPCPELSVLLLDWSSTWFIDSPTVSAQSRISPIMVPLLQAVVGGRLQQARQLVFGQVAVNGHSQSSVLEETMLITQRNDHALQQVLAELERSPNQTIALLYGCHHCPDLHKKLLQAGFQPSQTQWRTAWSVPAPTSVSESEVRSATPSTDMVGFLLVLLVLPLYFLVGGLDWMESILHVFQALEDGSDASAASSGLLYLLRHVFLYVGLSKLVLDGESIRI